MVKSMGPGPYQLGSNYVTVTICVTLVMLLKLSFLHIFHL